MGLTCLAQQIQKQKPARSTLVQKAKATPKSNRDRPAAAAASAKKQPSTPALVKAGRAVNLVGTAAVMARERGPTAAAAAAATAAATDINPDAVGSLYADTTAGGGGAVAAAAPARDAASVSSFFDRLVSLIPARFYRSADPSERLNLQYMKKGERAQAKADFKDKARAAKRAKLAGGRSEANGQPAAATAASATAGPSSTSAAGGGATPLLNIGGGGAGANASREHLQQRLQAKIEAMRAAREARERSHNAQQAKGWKTQTLEANAARKQTDGKAVATIDVAGVKRSANGQARGGVAAADSSGLIFPRLEVNDRQPGSKARGLPKKQSKAELLKAAEAKAKAAAAADAGGGDVDGDAWRAAAARASGQRVLDDPKLLRKSLKKEAKLKEKRTKAWTERTEAQKEAMDKRQAKRTENLRRRREGKVAKKVERREKKLLGGSGSGSGGGKQLRAGFEGRRDSFIGSKK